jgi:hypothetical protein
MIDPTFESLKTPLFLGPFIASAVVLFIIRMADIRACFAEKKHQATRVGWLPVKKIFALRVRFGSEAVLDSYPPAELCFWSPQFALSGILVREPASLLGPTAAWLAVLFGDPLMGAEIAGATLLWRMCYDVIVLHGMTPRQSATTVGLKVIWICATGVWFACLIWALLSALIIVAILIGAFTAQSGQSRRR